MIDKPLEKIDFVIFDIETTGLNPLNGDKIVEIAALRVRDGVIIDEFSSLVNPQRENSAYFINHIHGVELEKAPLIKDVLPKFLNFIKDSCLAVYNVEFDVSFIQNEARPNDIRFCQSRYLIDVMFMAKRLLLKSSNPSLKNAAYFLGLNSNQRHRALGDCRLTKDVLVKLLRLVKDRGIENFLEFYSIFGYNKSLDLGFQEEKLNIINKAIEGKNNLLIRYLSSWRMEINEREVTPHAIYKENNASFLSAFCHLRKEERKFNINGILKLQIV